MTDDVDRLMQMNDADYFAETGMCGACGCAVSLDQLAERFRTHRFLCTCTDCGCGPHPAFDIGRADVPHEQPDLFGGAA